VPHRTAAPLHVLVVEDDDDHALLIESALAAHDTRHHLSRARTGAEALERLLAQGEGADAQPLSLVLLDLDLPGVGGLYVLRAVKDNPALRPLPIVILTTSDADDDRRRAWEAGANSYLVKPVDYDRFVAMMARLGDYWAEWNRLAPGLTPTP
jgi:CheY-like chemotaxis protein